MLLRIIFLALYMSCSGGAWALVETALMPGAVISGHAKLEPNCKECHVRFDKDAQTKLCMDCHKEVAADFLGHKGFHGRLDEKECRDCHTDHKGRAANIAVLNLQTFDHSKTDFPLAGAHQRPEKVRCAGCHETRKKYRDAPLTCNGCHQKTDKHKGSLGTECANCHVERDWKEAKFDHGKTSFQLTGKHTEVTCKKCHADPSRYKGVSHECVTCHIAVDKHKGAYGKKCDTCHVEKDWKAIDFNHDRETPFKLLGKHVAVRCIACHKGSIYKEKAPTSCVSCHRNDDAHKGGLGEKCASCHTEEKWNSSKFDHDRNTKFMLLGKHIRTKCDACHKPESKEKLGSSCISCHRTNDKHKGDFGAKCETCHSEKDWKTIGFDHDSDTRYTLKGKHVQVRCIACHTGKLFQQKLNQDCLSCHAKHDVHKNQLGKRCESCHIEKDWKLAQVDHGRARFQLTGMHANVECKKCHLTQLFRDSPSDCFSCHKKDDVHKLRLDSKCESCHNARSWKAWDFNHDKRTKYKLDGAHKKTPCVACHTKAMNDSVVLPTSCVGCHEKNDVHSGEFGHLCERCHVTKNFKILNLDY